MTDILEFILSILKAGVTDFSVPSFFAIESELRLGLERYWEIAGRVLEGSGIRLLEPPVDYFSIDRNFFSLLFLYSFHRGGLPSHRRVRYVAINQCLRGMVTGCDNLLDDEYKKTLLTDLPEKGIRMRSVIDIMVSDRILFEILFDAFHSGEITQTQVKSAIGLSLRALTQSGTQEAAEEGGVESRLLPEEILTQVHHYKTALLFQCVWAIPERIEDVPPDSITAVKQALYRVGMGCQILDDMVDLLADIRNRRHNYVASLIYHGEPETWRHISDQMLFKRMGFENESNFPAGFTDIMKTAVKTATGFLESGLRSLFIPEHQALVQPAVRFIAGRIGALRFFPDVSR